jgi:MFS family permease
MSYFGMPSSSAIGGIVAAFSAGAIFGSFGCALVADRWGRVWGLRSGAVIAVIGVALQAGAVNVSCRLPVGDG